MDGHSVYGPPAAAGRLTTCAPKAVGASCQPTRKSETVEDMSRQLSPLPASVARFVEDVSAHPEAALLVFDFDGTLAPIVANPSDATILPSSAAELGRLGRQDCHIALVSGRPADLLRELSGLDRIHGLENVTVFGQYGAERFDASTGQTHAPTPPGSVTQAKSRLATLAAALPGATVEDKGLAVALHVRNCSDPQVAFANAEGPVRAVARALALTVEPGRFVWELRAATVNKGDALRTLVQEINPTAVLYAGDDLGDIPAFKVLGTLKQEGLSTCSVVVSSAENPGLWEGADIVCDGPEGLASWLGFLSQRIAEGSARR